MSEDARRSRVEVNGAGPTARSSRGCTLADFLREDLGLTGTHLGCEHGVCGDCTVLLDGETVRSCLMFAVQADGHAVDDGRGPGRARRHARPRCSRRSASTTGCSAASARRRCSSPRTSSCAATRTADRRGDPRGDPGDLCRCTGYQQIVDAIRARRGPEAKGEHEHRTASAAAKIALDRRRRRRRTRWLGKSINRVEDPRFLRGEGRYLDDIELPGMTHAAIVRSPHAHARIVAIDSVGAEALPGVVARRHRRGRDRARGTAPVLRGRADHPGHDRDGESAPLRRGRRGRRRRGPLHRRGRVRPDRGRVRAAARPCSTRSRPARRARRSCTRRSGRTSRTSGRSPSARSTGRSRGRAR